MKRGHPLHAEELALFKYARAATGKSQRGEKSIKELPAARPSWWPRRKIIFRPGIRQAADDYQKILQA